jgi:hypothetical protein
MFVTVADVESMFETMLCARWVSPLLKLHCLSSIALLLMSKVTVSQFVRQSEFITGSEICSIPISTGY